MQKQIIALLADGEVHSGAEMANALGVTLSAVQKQLDGLAERHLHYVEVCGKGYRLDKAMELLAAAKINAVVNGQAAALISSLEIHDQIDSTNRYLVERAKNNALSGTVCFAECQTEGKGRRGRQWISPYGSNIYLSILWRFQQGAAALSGLSLAIGVAVIRALKEHQIDDVGLKWPNDIYSQGKKLGGILIEVLGENDGSCSAVIGLGLNLLLSEAEAVGINQAWTDLSKITGQNRPSRNKLAGSLLNHLLPVIAEYEGRGITAHLDHWRSYDCLAGKAAILFIGQQQFEGIVQGIDDNGRLLIEGMDGSVLAFVSGEVSFNASVS